MCELRHPGVKSPRVIHLPKPIVSSSSAWPASLCTLSKLLPEHLLGTGVREEGLPCGQEYCMGELPQASFWEVSEKSQGPREMPLQVRA